MKEKNFMELFIKELNELVNKVKFLLAIIEKNPNNKDINSKFRLIFHTIKGNSGFMGLNNLHQFSLLIETIFTENVKINAKILFILQKSINIIEKYMQDLGEGELLDLEISYVNEMKNHIYKL